MDVNFNLYLTHIQIDKQKLLKMYKIKKKTSAYTIPMQLV